MDARFVDSLLAPGPHPSLGEDAATYGRLIGSWAGGSRITSRTEFRVRRAG